MINHGGSINATITSYLDGVEMTSTQNPSSSSTVGTVVGARTGLDEFWNGSIDELRIYNRSLKAEEVLSLYNRTREKYYDRKLSDNWDLIISTQPYLFDQGLWMWADYSCNATSWNLWEPEFLFRNCCVDCICSEDIT